MPGLYDSFTSRVAAWSPDVFLRISLFGLIAELLIASSTLLPGAPVLPQWPPFALFPGIFVVHLRSVVLLIERRRALGITGPWRRLPIRELFAGIPALIAVGFVCLFVGAVIVFLASIAHLEGQPTQIGSRFYLNNHGALIPVSHTVYRHALVLQQRIFTMIPAVFYGLGVILNHPARRVAGSLEQPV